MKLTAQVKKMPKAKPVTSFSITKGKCPQTGSNCGFIRKACKVYCWLK